MLISLLAISSNTQYTPNANKGKCEQLIEGYAERITISEDDPAPCFESENGFVISGKSLTLLDFSGSRSYPNPIAGGPGRFNVTSTIMPQEITVHEVTIFPNATETYINTYANWEGSVSFKHVVKNGETIQKNYVDMIFFNPNQFKGECKRRGSTMTLSENGFAHEADAILFTPMRVFDQVSVNSSKSEILGSSDFDVYGKLECDIEGNPHDGLPETLYIFNRHDIVTYDYQYTADGVKDYAGYIPLDTAYIVLIVILVLVVVGVVAFCIVWFVVLKKNKCCCCSCCCNKPVANSQEP